jgi:hypothetical protein
VEHKPAKEKSWVEKIGTAVGDMVRDIGTANEMAQDKLEDTAFKHVLKGGMTTMIGVGLEKAMDGIWDDVMSGKPLLHRPYLEVAEKTRNELRQLEKSNVPLYSFIKQASKDLASGVIYNGLAYFSRPMLKPAEGSHMLAAVAINAAEAWGTPGLASHLQSQRAQAEKQKALDEVKYWRDKVNASKKSIREAPQADAVAALKKQKAAQLAANRITVPEDTSMPWQTAFNENVLQYSNPATNLGVDMVVSGLKALHKNFKEVRKVRKEKGGLEGKKVFMPKKGDWKERPWQERQNKPQHEYQKPYQGNQDKPQREYHGKPGQDQVYYGKSHWKDSRKQPEVELEKFD